MAKDFDRIAQAYLTTALTNGAVCPWCGSEDIAGHSMDFATGRISQKMSCNACQKTWHNGYGLDSVAFDDSADPIAIHYAEAPVDKALADLVNTIEAAGGVAPAGDGNYYPLGDPEWIDLAEVYVQACAALDREPMIEASDDESATADDDDSPAAGHQGQSA